jgi:hypothetical protein
MIMSWVETHDDWDVILSYEMWDIRSVNRVYVDNLGPTSIGETAEILVEILVEPVYWKKKLPENFQYIARKIGVVTVGIRARLWFNRLCKHEKYNESCILR